MCSTGFRCARRSKSSCAWYLGKNKGNQSVIFTTIIKHFSSNQVTVIFTTIIKHFYSNQSQSRLKSAFKYLIIFTIWLYNYYVYKMRKNTGASPTEMWLPPMNKTIKIHLNLFNLIIDQVKETMEHKYITSHAQRKNQEAAQVSGSSPSQGLAPQLYQFPSPMLYTYR